MCIDIASRRYLSHINQSHTGLRAGRTHGEPDVASGAPRGGMKSGRLDTSADRS